MTKRFLLVAGPALTLALSGCTLQLGAPQPTSVVEVRVPERSTRVALPKAPNADPALTTVDFESGQCTLAAAPADSLEAFLRDLNRRKDYDYACNNGQPGENSAYLWQWVSNVVAELQNRGYYFDDAGNFHRPSTVIAIR